MEFLLIHTRLVWMSVSRYMRESSHTPSICHVVYRERLFIYGEGEMVDDGRRLD